MFTDLYLYLCVLSHTHVDVHPKVPARLWQERFGGEQCPARGGTWQAGHPVGTATTTDTDPGGDGAPRARGALPGLGRSRVRDWESLKLPQEGKHPLGSGPRSPSLKMKH